MHLVPVGDRENCSEDAHALRSRIDQHIPQAAGIANSAAAVWRAFGTPEAFHLQVRGATEPNEPNGIVAPVWDAGGETLA